MGRLLRRLRIEAVVGGGRMYGTDLGRKLYFRKKGIQEGGGGGGGDRKVNTEICLKGV